MKALLFLAIIPLFTLSFKDKLIHGSSGDFMVYKQQRAYTIFILCDKSDPHMTIEEITVPSHRESTKSWREWLEEGAHGCTSWLRYRINTKTERVEETYSVTRKCWLPVDGNEPLIATLFRETLLEIPEKKRKHLPAKPGTLKQEIWTPPLIVDGVRQLEQAAAYSLYWPSDGSEISGQPLDLYFSEKSPFPYWIELTARNMRFRGIDSGKGLAIKKRENRPKPLDFRKVTKDKGQLLLEIHNPSILPRIDVYLTVNKENNLETRPCTILSKQQDKELLIISATLPGEKGELIAIPQDHPELATSYQID